eukprot:2485240-Pleurochrysis_carterae.AAC.1
MASARASGADPRPGPQLGPLGHGGLEPTGPFNSHFANGPGYPNSFSSGSSGRSAHMQQKTDLLLLQHQAKLERDKVVRSALPPPLRHLSIAPLSLLDCPARSFW